MNKRRHLRAAIALLFCTLLLAGCIAAPQPTVKADTNPTDAAVIATVQSQSPESTGSPATVVTDSGIKGLVLVIPVLVKNVETIKEDIREDGTYREELMFDGMVSIVDERLVSVEYSEESIAKQIAKLNGVDTSDRAVKKDDAISAKLSYPAWRITYTTGKNEDTRKNVDIYIQTDEWDFRFHTSTPIDSFADYTESIESWIESIDLFDGK